MFDGSIRDEHLAPRNRSGGVFLLIAIAIGFWLVVAATTMAVAQQPPAPPSGQAVFNQARSARALTKSDTTVFTATRGLFIGDAAACNIAVRFIQDSAAVTLTNVQAGANLPYSIIQLMSAGTSCTTVFAFY